MFPKHGQTILEYTIIVGIVTVVLFYMGTAIKRGEQSLVKVTADQVGNQQNADQDFTDTRQGYMESSNSLTNETKAKQTTAIGYIPATGYNPLTYNAIEDTSISENETTDTITNTITNGGFSQTSQ
jgi:hypothetical protein